MKHELTDKQIDDITRQHGTGGWMTVSDLRTHARAVIAAHEAPKADTSSGQDAYSFTGTLVQIVDKKVAEIAALKAALAELLDCPFDIDKATVAKCGLEETMRLNPHQVVGNMSVSLVRIRQARAALAQGDPK